MSILFNTLNSNTTEKIERRHTREPLSAAAVTPSPFAVLRASALFSTASGRVKIAFAGVAAGVGSTTLCFAAAEYLASLNASCRAGAKPGRRYISRNVTLLELDLKPENPAGKSYDKIGIDRRFAGRDYISLYRLAAEGRPLHGLMNIDGGICWALRVPGEPLPTPDPTVLHRLVNNVTGDIILCDISATGIMDASGPLKGREALAALLADFDHIVCVIDPLPSRLLASVPAAEVCRAVAAAGVPVTYIFNKLNAGVNFREVTRFTGVKDFLPFPAIPAEAVYSAEYACRSLAPELASSLSSLFPG